MKENQSEKISLYQFKQDIILVVVSYYCRFSLSYRDVSEIL
ncbi:hypothetical protein IKE_05632 [Bacillus cereus VD196]|uniref:IS6 family transposase n=1 Tax=Bacillus cereus VD196 TaxID=1053243 RepID=A0A9W5V695_BACCE|nr:hypothetical protein IKG_05909 [Bacillus cereus VD200]EOO62539.1 hypothetical protein IKE_05632 [Bacillus cereus VD196]